MKSLVKLLAIPIAILVFKGDNLEHRLNNASNNWLSSDVRKLSNRYEEFNKNVDLSKYLGNNTSALMHEQGYLSQDYEARRNNSRKAKDVWHEWESIYLDAVNENMASHRKFEQTKDIKHAQAAILAGVEALNTNPYGPYTQIIMQRMKEITQGIDDLK